MTDKTCTACGGKKHWSAHDKLCFSHSRTVVCCLCRGSGIMPDYPEPQPARPPSHYLQATRDQGPSWCLNAEMDPTSGHQPCTEMVNILHTLIETGDTWREVTFDEVMKHRGVFEPLEFHFNKVLKYSSESRGVATFCSEWRDVFNWDDSLGRSMKRQILSLKKQDP